MYATLRRRAAGWLLLLALLSGCGPRDSAPPQPDADEALAAARGFGPKPNDTSALTQVYKDEKTGLTIKSPEGWVAAAYDGALVALVSPQNGEEDLFLENVVVTADDQFTDLTMVNYLTALDSELRKRYPDTQTVESGEVEIAGLPAHWMVDTFTGPKGPSKVYRVVFIRESTAYVFHGTALAQTFDRYRPAFEAMARSIDWPPPTP